MPPPPQRQPLARTVLPLIVLLLLGSGAPAGAQQDPEPAPPFQPQTCPVKLDGEQGEIEPAHCPPPPGRYPPHVSLDPHAGGMLNASLCAERERVVPGVRILIVNERNSRFGLGWSMPGLQQVYDQGDGVLLSRVTDLRSGSPATRMAATELRTASSAP
jgi:hypothetical protein